MDTKIRVSPEYFLLLLLTYTIFAEKIKYMRIDIITVLPEMIEGFFNCSIMKRAQNKGLQKYIFITFVIMLKINTVGWMIILLVVLPEWL